MWLQFQPVMQDIQYYYVYCVELLLTLHLSVLEEHFLGGIDETVRRVSVLLHRPGMLYIGSSTM